jgi:cell division septum initiation protein DivIVA
MDLAARLQQLEDMVRDAKSMPLSSSALLNREEVLDLVKDMKESLPDEIRQARWVVKDREELLGKARRDAEAMVEQGQEEQLRLASREAVVQRAQEESDRILQEAGEDARRIRLEAEDYVDAKLAQFEIVLRKLQEETQASARQFARTLDQVELGREKLRGAPTTAAEDEFGTDDLDGATPADDPAVDLHDQEVDG